MEATRYFNREDATGRPCCKNLSAMSALLQNRTMPAPHDSLFLRDVLAVPSSRNVLLARLTVLRDVRDTRICEMSVVYSRNCSAMSLLFRFARCRLLHQAKFLAGCLNVQLGGMSRLLSLYRFRVRRLLNQTPSPL